MSGTETLSTSTTSRRTGGGWGSAMTQWASSPPPTWRPSRSSDYGDTTSPATYSETV